MELEESKSMRNGQLDLLLDTLNSIKIRPHGEASAAIFLLFFFAATSWKCSHGVAVAALLLHDAAAAAAAAGAQCERLHFLTM